MIISRNQRPVIFAILLTLATLGFRAPEFFSAGTAIELFISNVPVLIVALGMTLVILCGEIDISVGSVFAVISVTAGVLAQSGVPIALNLAAACILGLFLGALNGALVAYVEIPSIIVTLAGLVAWRAALIWWTGGAWIQDLPRSFQWLGLAQSSYVVLTFVIIVLLIALLAFILSFVAAGRTIYAVGSNPEAARLAGVSTRAVRAWAFAVLGALVGLAAVWNAVRFQQIPSNTGLGLELKAIAAVAIGGTAIRGGSGGVLSTMFGVALLSIIGPTLTFLGVNAYWEKAIQGFMILAAVAGPASGVARPRERARA